MMLKSTLTRIMGINNGIVWISATSDKLITQVVIHLYTTLH